MEGVACGASHKRQPRYAALALLVLLVFLLSACGGGGGPVRHARAQTTPVWSGTPVATPAPPAAGDWPAFGYDAARSGVNLTETAITPSSVAGLRQLWRVSLPGVADSAPILLHALTLPNGTTRDLLYVTTRDGRLLAVDAATGAILWSRQPTGPKITHSSPVADPTRQFVYAYGLDGALHKYRATTGDEVSGNGWPARVTLMTGTEKESGALNAANGRVYVVTSGYIGDAPPYQGHVVTVDEAAGSTTVYNSLCSNIMHLLVSVDCSSEQSGIWARAGSVVDPVTGDVFVTTGNGPYTGDSGGHDWGDSVLELTPDGSRLLDSYTPDDYQQLDQSDADLGSVAPALLPTIPHSATPYLLVQEGKDGKLRLLNRQNLSGAGGPGYTGGERQIISLECGVFHQPAVWTDMAGEVWVIVPTVCGLRAFRAATDAHGETKLVAAWKTDGTTTSPVLAGGVLYTLTSNAALALDPRTGKTLWTSARPAVGGTIGNVHWESPIVAGGRLYCSDENGDLYAFGL
ncbi:MAG TPA: PQQ-binding-like beta-propeller repeat protein [Ktedonobacterales bacterium]|nr:PQQ-binding-like beta-propeller repeat protein [Ktedonobacterales bacterium]